MADTITEWTTVIVGTANERGVKAQGDTEWINWSKHGTPSEEERPKPPRGAKVKLGLDKDGYIRAMKDKDGNDLAKGGSAGGTVVGLAGGIGMTDADKRRITLLSCLASATRLYAGLGLPLVPEGEQEEKGRMLKMPMRTAMWWAKQIDPDLFKKPEQETQNDRSD